MDKIRLTCEGCGKRYKIAAEKLGRQRKCPDCGSILRTVAPSAEPIAVAELVPEDKPAEKSAGQLADPLANPGNAFADLNIPAPATVQNFVGPAPPRVAAAPVENPETPKKQSFGPSANDYLSQAQRTAGPWQHGRYLVIEGSQKLPQRCIRSDGPGEIEVHENIQYLPFSLQFLHTIAVLLFGVLGSILASMLTASAVEQQTIRFYMTRKHYWPREIAKWTLTTSAILSTAIASYYIVMTAMHFAFYERPIVARGQHAPTAAESLPASYPITILICVGIVILAGLVIPFVRPIWVHQVEPNGGRVWLTGPCHAYRSRFSQLSGALRQPMHTIYQQITLCSAAFLIALAFAARPIYNAVNTIAQSKEMLAGADQPFEPASVPLPTFLPAPKANAWREFYRIDADLGVAEDEPGNADRLLAIYPKEPTTEKTNAVVFLTAPGATLLTGATLVEPTDEMLDIVRRGFVIVMYECDGYLDALNEPITSLQSAAQKYSQSMAGLVNGRNAITYAIKHLPGIDPNRLYTVGHSSAGRQAMMLAAHDKRIRAFGSLAGVTNSERIVSTVDLQELNKIVPGCESWLKRISPITHADKIQCPSYFVHLSEDRVVLPRQSANMVDLLKKNGVLVETLFVDGKDHYHETAERGYESFARWLASIDRVVEQDEAIKLEPTASADFAKRTATDRAELDRLPQPVFDFAGATPNSVSIYKLRTDTKDVAIDWDSQHIVMTNEYAGFAVYRIGESGAAVWTPNYVQDANGGPVSMAIKTISGKKTLVSIASEDAKKDEWILRLHDLDANKTLPDVHFEASEDFTPMVLAGYEDANDSRIFVMARNRRGVRLPTALDLVSGKSSEGESASLSLNAYDHRWYRWNAKSFFYPASYTPDQIQQCVQLNRDSPAEPLSLFAKRNALTFRLLQDAKHKWFFGGFGLEGYLGSKSFEEYVREHRKPPIGLPIGKYRAFVHVDETGLRLTDFDSGKTLGMVKLPSQSSDTSVSTTDVPGTVNEKLHRCLEIATDPEETKLVAIFRDLVVTLELEQLGLRQRADVNWPSRPFANPIRSEEITSIPWPTTEPATSVRIDGTNAQFKHDVAKGALQFLVPENLTGQRTIRISVGEGEKVVSRDYLAVVQNASVACPIKRPKIAANRSGSLAVVWSGTEKHGANNPVASQLALFRANSDSDPPVASKKGSFGPVLDLPGNVSDVQIGKTDVWVTLTSADPQKLDQIPRADRPLKDEGTNLVVLIKLKSDGTSLQPSTYRSVPRSFTSIRLFNDRVLAVGPPLSNNLNRRLVVQRTLRVDAANLKDMSPALLTHSPEARAHNGLNEFVWDGVVYESANTKNRYLKEFCLEQEKPKDMRGQNNLSVTTTNTATFLFPAFTADPRSGHAKPLACPQISVTKPSRARDQQAETSHEIRVTNGQGDSILLNAHFVSKYATSTSLSDRALFLVSDSRMYVLNLNEESQEILKGKSVNPIQWLNPTLEAGKSLELQYQVVDADEVELEVRHAFWAEKTPVMHNAQTVLLQESSSDGRFEVDFSDVYPALVGRLIRSTVPTPFQVNAELSELNKKNLKRTARVTPAIQNRSRTEIDALRKQAQKNAHQRRVSLYSKLAIAAAKRITGKRTSSVPIPVNIIVRSNHEEKTNAIFSHQIIVNVPRSVLTKSFIDEYPSTR